METFMVEYGYFTSESRGGIMYFTNEKGEDWYDILKTLSKYGPSGELIEADFSTFVAVDEHNVIQHVEYDPSRLVPNDRLIVGIDMPVEQVTAGMRYVDGALLDPLPAKAPKVTQITMRQAKIQLSRSGHLADVQAAIDAMDGQEGEEARIEWEYATTLERDHNLVAIMSEGLNLSEEAIDNLFESASHI